MSSESPKTGFRQAFVEGLISKLPDEILAAEVIRRGGDVEKAIGEASTKFINTPGLVASIFTGEERAFRSRIGDFLDSDTKLAATDQLALMSDFWGKSGMKVPDLSEEQQDKLDEVTERNPSHRVVPTPLMGSLRGSLYGRGILSERQTLAEAVREGIFIEHILQPDTNVLAAPELEPQTIWGRDVYGWLLAGPDDNVESGDNAYALRYKTEQGELVSRPEYVDSLKESGTAIETGNGYVWTFPVMDVRTNAERIYSENHNHWLDGKEGEWHNLVNYVASPESLITTQLLRLVRGAPFPEFEVDLANEAIYEMDAEDNPKNLVMLTGVGLDELESGQRQVSAGGWVVAHTSGWYGVRSAESGI